MAEGRLMGGTSSTVAMCGSCAADDVERALERIETTLDGVWYRCGNCDNPKGKLRIKWIGLA